MPVISNIVYTVTDTTIVVTYTTDTSSDTNLSAGGKAAIDNGVAANSTSHQAIVTGLVPNTTYSCVVTSGGTSSAAQNVTTAVAQTRTPILSATNGAATQTQDNTKQWGDTFFTCVADDNNTYLCMGDGYGLAAAQNAGANMQVCKITNETTFVGTSVNLLTNYFGFNTFNGTDGPSGGTLTNKPTGIYSLNGHLFIWSSRNTGISGTFPFGGQYSCAVQKSTDHGATWANWEHPGSTNANGAAPDAWGDFAFANKNIGWVTPVLYAADDGTLGYKTAGNQIDGANGYIYCTYQDTTSTNPPTVGGAAGQTIFLMRIPRIQLDALNTSAAQYWIGGTPGGPSDFVNDSNWANTPASETPILSFPANFAWPQITFIPKINYYLMTTYRQPQSGIQGHRFLFYAGPTPAGPWTLIYQADRNPTTEYYGPFVMHRDAASNTLTDAIPIRILYSGLSITYYQVNVSTITLNTTGTPTNPVPLYADNFYRANENPLSDSSKWTNFPTTTFPANSGAVTSKLFNQTVAGPSGNVAYLRAASPSTLQDQEIEITLAGSTTNTGKGVGGMLRMSGSGGTQACYDAFIGDGSNSVQIGKTTGNVRSVPGPNQTTGTITAADIWRFTATGQSTTTLTLYQNGTQILQVTDSSSPILSGQFGVSAAGSIAPAAAESLWVGGANQAVPPVFSPAWGNVVNGQKVTITSPTSGATIYYTTDGSTPTTSSSSIANGGTVTINSAITLKAIAATTNYVPSQVTGASFNNNASSGAGGGGSGSLGQQILLGDSSSLGVRRHLNG